MVRINRKRIISRKYPDKKPWAERILPWVGITIAVVPTLCYLFYFIFTFGYFLFFNIPVSFLSFNLQDIIKSILTITSYCFFALFISLIPTFSLYFWFNQKGVSEAFDLGSFLYIEISISLILVNSYFINLLPLFSIYQITFLLMDVFFLLLLYFNIKSSINIYLKKDKFIKNILFQPKLSWLLTYLRRNYSKRHTVNILIVLDFLFFLVFFYGVVDAVSRKNYYIINQSPECVILYMNSNTAICSPFDRKSKEVERIFKIVNLSQNSNYQIEEENIGPLKLKDLSIPTTIPIPTPTNTPVPPTPTIINPTITKTP